MVRKTKPKPPGGAKGWVALAFLAPAIVVLGALILYPTFDTIAQSFQADTTREWIGLANYREMISSPRVITAIRNTAIWVLTAPILITGVGLIFAVITEHVGYGTAVKIVLFMPMAISLLATGVMWRLVYEQDPDKGLLNAAAAAAANVVEPSGDYPGARPPNNAPLRTEGRAVVTEETVSSGGTIGIGLVGVLEPPEAKQTAPPETSSDQVGIVVWRDFKPEGGRVGKIDDGEVGLPAVPVELIDKSDNVVASGITGSDGNALLTPEGSGPFRARVPPDAFEPGFSGITWLGPTLATPAIIVAFFWVHVGFAVVIIAAGLSALPRDVLEAARVDGANEWQVFRYITAPLLAPVLGVVFITLLINVLKVFDIVYVLAPPSVHDEANVIALEMWRSAFTAHQYGLGSAVAVLLFMLVIPIMALNIRRFRGDD